MANVFSRKLKGHSFFTWESLGNISEGRGDLGEEMPVLVYRLMQFTMLDVLIKAHGEARANEYFRQAGFMAGAEFTRNVMDLNIDFDTFMSDLQRKMREMKIGILRVETIDHATGKITLTVAQDLDCSGLPVTNENVCTYDEGFIAGILETYTGKHYNVREVDCWANGDRVCRFNGTVVDKENVD